MVWTLVNFDGIEETFHKNYLHAEIKNNNFQKESLWWTFFLSFHIKNSSKVCSSNYLYVVK